MDKIIVTEAMIKSLIFNQCVNTSLILKLELIGISIDTVHNLEITDLILDMMAVKLDDNNDEDYQLLNVYYSLYNKSLHLDVINNRIGVEKLSVEIFEFLLKLKKDKTK